ERRGRWSPLSAERGFAQQIGEKAQIRNQHSPIANLEHPSALSLAIRPAAKLLIRLIVEGCSKLAIGECWLRIFGPSSSGAICCAKPVLCGDSRIRRLPAAPGCVRPRGGGPSVRPRRTVWSQSRPLPLPCLPDTASSPSGR